MMSAKPYFTKKDCLAEKVGMINFNGLQRKWVCQIPLLSPLYTPFIPPKNPP
jgi:hypothetical protein